MEAAEHACPGHTFVALFELHGLPHDLCERLHVPRLGEAAAVVLEHARTDQHQAFQSGGCKFHGNSQRRFYKDA